MCCVADLLRLVRINNLLLAAAGVLAGGWIALGMVERPANVLWLAAVAAGGVGVAGNVLDGIWDPAADMVERPGGGRPLAPPPLPPRPAHPCRAGGGPPGPSRAA